MKTKWLLSLCLILLTASCTPATQAPAPAESGRSFTWIDAPLDGSRLPPGTYEIVAHANAPAGIAAVELLINGQPVAEFTSGQAVAYMTTVRQPWEAQQPGLYQIQAQVKDTTGKLGAGDAVQVEILAAEPATAPLTPTLTATSTPAPTATPTALPSELLARLLVSPSQAYVGNCGVNQIQFTALVNDPQTVKGLVLFVKLRDMKTGEETSWNNGFVMNPSSPAGTFVYTLATSAIPQAGLFESAWLIYQLVGSDASGTIVNRSPVYGDVSLLRCGAPLPIFTLQPMPTFVLFTPVPTPTPIMIK